MCIPILALLLSLSRGCTTSSSTLDEENNECDYLVTEPSSWLLYFNHSTDSQSFLKYDTRQLSKNGFPSINASVERSIVGFSELRPSGNYKTVGLCVQDETDSSIELMFENLSINDTNFSTLYSYNQTEGDCGFPQINILRKGHGPDFSNSDSSFRPKLKRRLRHLPDNGNRPLTEAGARRRDRTRNRDVSFVLKRCKRQRQRRKVKRDKGKKSHRRSCWQRTYDNLLKLNKISRRLLKVTRKIKQSRKRLKERSRKDSSVRNFLASTGKHFSRRKRAAHDFNNWEVSYQLCGNLKQSMHAPKKRGGIPLSDRLVFRMNTNILKVDVKWIGNSPSSIAILNGLILHINFVPKQFQQESSSESLSRLMSTSTVSNASSFNNTLAIRLVGKDTDDFNQKQTKNLSNTSSNLQALWIAVLFVLCIAVIALYFTLRNNCSQRRVTECCNSDTMPRLNTNQCDHEVAPESDCDKKETRKDSFCSEEQVSQYSETSGMLAHYSPEENEQCYKQKRRHDAKVRHKQSSVCCCGDQAGRSSPILQTDHSATSTSTMINEGSPEGSTTLKSLRHGHLTNNNHLQDASLSHYSAMFPSSVAFPSHARKGVLKGLDRNGSIESTCFKPPPNRTLVRNDGIYVTSISQGQLLVNRESSGSEASLHIPDRHQHDMTTPLNSHSGHVSCTRHNSFHRFESRLTDNGRVQSNTDGDYTRDPPPEYSDPPGYYALV